MRAILLDKPGGVENLRVGEYPKPEPGTGEVLIRVVTTALNRADILQRKGFYPSPEGASPLMGLEVAGEVTAVGVGVERWQKGDKVCALLAGGGYAEYVTVDQGLVMPVPLGIALEDAAAIPEAFLTAYQALFWLGRIQKGERVLLHAGASGVGTAAIQLAREAGAQVVVTASGEKHGLCRDLGALGCIDYKNEDFVEATLALTAGEGVDIIIDPVGSPYLEGNIELLRTDGRLVWLAFMGGHRVENFDLAPVLRKRLHLMGTTLRSRSLDYKRRLVASFGEFSYYRFQSGGLQPVIDRVFDWQEVAHAHQYMEDNRNVGKILLRVN